MSSEQNTIPGITRRLMFHTLAKTSSKYLEMDADITWTLNRLPFCYSLNHAILNFRVVNVTFSGGKYPGGQEKSLSVCVLFCCTFARWSTPPPLWGHTCTTTPVHRLDTAPPFIMPHAHIVHRPSYLIPHTSSLIIPPSSPCLSSKKKKNVTTLLPLYFWNVGNPFVYGLSTTFVVIQQGF